MATVASFKGFFIITIIVKCKSLALAGSRAYVAITTIVDS